MPDAKQRLRSLDRIDPPDVWHRARQLEPIGEVPGTTEPSWQKRVAAGAVAFAVFAGAIAIALGAFRADRPADVVRDGGEPARGDPVPTPSLAGDPVPTPTTFPANLDPIEVTTPARGAEVTSPVTIEGSADVYEATVSIQIYDAAGNRIVDTFTTATCGSGCRGDFSASVPFSVESSQQGTIVVFESSAETGERLNTVRVPVTLHP
jgi:Immunoglobulin-like domain of bacterial spore germination